MMVKGFKTVKTLNGDVVQEVDGIAIPLQMRVYFDNPLTFEGELKWIVGCVTSQGEVLPSVENSIDFKLGQIKELTFDAIDEPLKNKTLGEITGLDLLQVMKYLFIKNINDKNTTIIDLPAGE